MKQLILAAATLAACACMGAAQAQTNDSGTETTTVTRTTFPPYSAGFQAHAYIGVGAAIVKDQVSDDYRGNAKLFGGYDFTPNWGVEAGYIHYDKRNGGTYDGLGQFTPLKFKGFDSYVAAKYTVPLSERMSVFGKLGLEHSERTIRGGSVYDISQRDNGVYGALGLQYGLTSNLAVTAEYERFGKDKDFGSKADAITVGLKYGF